MALKGASPVSIRESVMAREESEPGCKIRARPSSFIRKNWVVFGNKYSRCWTLSKYQELEAVEAVSVMSKYATGRDQPTQCRIICRMPVRQHLYDTTGNTKAPSGTHK